MAATGAPSHRLRFGLGILLGTAAAVAIGYRLLDGSLADGRARSDERAAAAAVRSLGAVVERAIGDGEAIRSAVTLIDSLSAEVRAKPATLNFVLTNGRRMYALRRGKPLCMVERQGLHDPINGGHTPKPSSPVTSLRYVMTVSDGPKETPQGWTAVEEGAVLVVHRDLSHQMHPL